MMSLFFIPYFFPLHYSPFAFKEPARKRKIRGEQNKKIPNAKAFGILVRMKGLEPPRYRYH